MTPPSKSQPNILTQIAATTRQRVSEQKTKRPLSALKAELEHCSHQPLDFAAQFTGSGHDVIAEVKFASPSQGRIVNPGQPGLDPVTVAQNYQAHGAQALSVLTEPDFFQGDIAYLQAIRDALPKLPLLLKDFILNPYQLYLGRVSGADACLLMASLLEQPELETLYALALELGLTPLVEVHDRDEMERARALDAKLIGINNRNLKNLQVDLATGEALIRQAPSQATLICESGLKTPADLQRMTQAGFHGFLIGTHLMATGQPGQALKELLEPLDA